MIQAFVSLKPQQPPRTESGMRSFFEALQGAVFSQPTIFRTNADQSARPYSLDAICEAALNPRCKFVVLRAECEKFWQCTFLLPDKQGMGALFFDLQRVQNPRRLSAESLIEMFKKLYTSLSPRLIRIGDSEAREKLRSRHGLVMMPGLGRIEWLQIVAPEVYSDIYNPTDLVVAPGYQTEIWDDGALFMRVYDDPNDWDSEDNISQANFIPGFLAGVAKIRDNEKEKETLRELERLWSRAEKTAEKAYEVLDATEGSGAVAASEQAQTQMRATQPVESADLDRLVESSNARLDAEDARKRSVVFARLKSEYAIKEDNIFKVGEEGICTIFKAIPDKKAPFFASYQDLDKKVFILNAIEDLARFISVNDCTLNDAKLPRIKELIKTYYHPEYAMLDSLDDLPSNVVRDRRVPQLREQFKTPAVEDINDNMTLTFWFYKPDTMGVETLTLRQYQDWPIQLEVKIQCTDMENEPETPAPTVDAKPEPAQQPLPAAPQQTATEKVDDGATTLDPPKATPVPRRSTASEAEQNLPVPKKSGSNGAKIAIIAVFVIAILYIAFVFVLNGGNWNPMDFINTLNK